MIASLVLLTLASGYYTPQEAQALFAQSNQAFAQEQYPQAKENLQRLLDHGYGGPDVLYNLGTIELAQGQLGWAVLHLEQARRQGGSSPDLEANLALARTRQLDKLVGGQTEAGIDPAPFWALPTRALGITFLAAWVLGACLLLARRFLPAGRGWALGLGLLGLLVAATSGGVLLAQHYVTSQRVEAVVLAPTLQAHELPQPNAKISFEVHEGLKVRLLGEHGDFVHLRLPNGLEGWSEKGGLARI